MKHSRDELEYAISQYIDGTLAPIERPALEELLASDPQARALLEEYRRFDTVLKRSIPVPSIDWNRLSDQISQAVAAEEAPVRNFSLRRVGGVRGLAVAAAVLMVVSLAVQLARMDPSRTTTVTNDGLPSTKGSAVITVMAPQQADTSIAAVEQIQIGPSPTYASDTRVSEEFVDRPTVVLIDRAASPWQDSDSSLY